MTSSTTDKTTNIRRLRHIRNGFLVLTSTHVTVKSMSQPTVCNNQSLSYHSLLIICRSHTGVEFDILIKLRAMIRFPWNKSNCRYIVRVGTWIFVTCYKIILTSYSSSFLVYANIWKPRFVILHVTLLYFLTTRQSMLGYNHMCHVVHVDYSRTYA